MHKGLVTSKVYDIHLISLKIISLLYKKHDGSIFWTNISIQWKGNF